MRETLIKERMTAEEYFALPGLSQSSMKDLAISPLRFWWLHVNPNREQKEPSREMILGQALHCLVLEPSEFSKRFAPMFQEPEGCLDTVADLKACLDSHGVKPKSGMVKADMVRLVLEIEPGARIKETLASEYGQQNAGKTFLNDDDWARLHTAKDAILAEPEVQRILDKGEFEVSFAVKDPDTGVTLKSRMDWVRPELTFDLKTFQTKRVKSLDECVHDAIWNEGYFKQAYFYTKVRTIAGGDFYRENRSPDFVLGFVESEQPHETRIKVLRSTTGGEVNVYWEQARIEFRRLVNLYADCLAHFGTNQPWRTTQQLDPLMDTDLKALAWI